MRIITLILLVLLAVLNHRLWLSDDGGFQKVWLLQDAIKAQEGENNSLKERNQTLEAEVKDLKEGFAAVEERARLELGMIRQGETFFHILEGLLPAATVLAVQKSSTQQPVVQKQWRQKTSQKPVARRTVAQKPSVKPARQQPAVQKPAQKPTVQKPTQKPAVQKPVVPQVTQKQPVQRSTAQKPAVQKPAPSQPQGPRLTKHDD